VALVKPLGLNRLKENEIQTRSHQRFGIPNWGKLKLVADHNVLE
jgi:hypothetical protein